MLEDTENIHFSLVARGNEELKQYFLEKQTKFFNENYPENVTKTEEVTEGIIDSMIEHTNEDIKYIIEE